MTEPEQRLIIIPSFKLNALLLESPLAQAPPPGTPVVAPEAGLQQQSPQQQPRPGILAYELDQQIDLSELK
eukprot:CAMPEP_0201563984 /NCGR_PEP_ID=MMETSP0190_2-20130828/1689_1 /ASSEMBLY_ACC=CAM_ASM_000263 /TAXON_ID=37353 /ORGANISM="Rosalina sp." /LENGTH=70 /DNA_ID=CAMNT_0047979501 /DNA_START=9 /DNA_END=218 /DNA_ORIENTATION=+